MYLHNNGHLKVTFIRPYIVQLPTGFGKSLMYVLLQHQTGRSLDKVRLGSSSTESQQMYQIIGKTRFRFS